MYKDIVISLLGALLLESVFKTTEVGEQIAMIMGLAAMLFIFCLFCEKLRGGITGERRESTGNIADAGADTDATA